MRFVGNMLPSCYLTTFAVEEINELISVYDSGYPRAAINTAVKIPSCNDHEGVIGIVTRHDDLLPIS